MSRIKNSEMYREEFNALYDSMDDSEYQYELYKATHGVGHQLGEISPPNTKRDEGISESGGVPPSDNPKQVNREKGESN